MDLQDIDTTTAQPNGKFGEPIKAAFEKINTNNGTIEAAVAANATAVATNAQTIAAVAAAKLDKTGGPVTGPISVTGPGGTRLYLQVDDDSVPMIRARNTADDGYMPLRLRATRLEMSAEARVDSIQLPATTLGLHLSWNSYGSENGYGCNEYINYRQGGTGGHVFYAWANNNALRRSAHISQGGHITAYPEAPNPGNSNRSFGFRTQGSFGGGYGMVDGSTQGGWWMSFGNLNWGVAPADSGLPSLMSMNGSGDVTAKSFNPTSSADVKDYLEGYAGDADAELDRLVVISYKYRPEFAEDPRTLVGLLAENLQAVKPEAVGGGFDRVTEVPVLDEAGEPVMENGVPKTERVVEHVPLNVDMMQVLALNTRAHQQKNRRIHALEFALETLALRVAALEAASHG